MRKLCVVSMFVALFSLSAFAAETGDHPKAEFAAGYQYTHLEGGFNASGFNFAGTANLNSSVGITADFGSSFTSQDGVSYHNYTYTFGPQLALRANKAYTPFVHALIGGDHASAGFSGISATGNGMALLAGGGVDFNFNRYMSFRASGDWMMIHGNGSTSSKNFRMPIGVVFKF